MCRLREAALAEANGWHRTILPDYAQQDCIHSGNKILRRRGLDRILESDEVNFLVRHYSHIDQVSQAAEEWWAGAVALNHFLTGLPDMIAELATTNLGQRHKWRAWIVNTQHSEQLGSHWFTVVVGATVENVPELLQSTASSSVVRSVPELTQSHASSSAVAREPLDSIPIESEANAARLNNYQNLFDSPGAAIDLITWARAHTTYPSVSAWLEACSQWDAAVVSKEHMGQKKRRKLCKKHGIPLTRELDANGTIEEVMEHVRRKLLAQMQEIQSQRQLPTVFGLLQSSPSPSTADIHSLLQSAGSEPPHSQKRSAPANREDQSPHKRRVFADTTLQPPPKKAKHQRDNKLDNYFTLRAAGDARPEIEELRIPDVATDVSSTYLCLHAKKHIYTEDENFRIVKNALYQLRGHVEQRNLRHMTTDPLKTSKTIRQSFKQAMFKTIMFDVPKSVDKGTGANEGKAARHHMDHSHTWRMYYVRLLVLAQARRWLSATERLDPIADAPPTPKTNFQLADAIKQPKNAEFAPFGSA